MSAQRFVVFLRYADPDGKTVTVDVAFDTLDAAVHHVTFVFREGHFLVVPSPPMQEDGMIAIYIPTSRIISTHIAVEEQ